LVTPPINDQTKTQIRSVGEPLAHRQNLVKVLGNSHLRNDRYKADIPAEDTKIVAEAVIPAMKAG
jgi:hypothetical protein